MIVIGEWMIRVSDISAYKFHEALGFKPLVVVVLKNGMEITGYAETEVLNRILDDMKHV